MYSFVSVVFKYIFILIIYLFILSIIRLIYLDIKAMNTSSADNATYLKLINKIESLPFKIKEYYPIDKEIILGRANDNDIVIKDPFISKGHIKIVLDEGQYYLEDLDSANGTYVNKEKILDAVKLNNGDIITVGQIEFLFVNRE